MDRDHVNAWGKSPIVILNHSVDSTRWKLIHLREGDVVVASWAKAGTTWLQQVVTQMTYGIGGRYMLSKSAPWVDSPYTPEDVLLRLESKYSRPCRVFKSHLDARALPYRDDVKYIYVARDGRDALWSWYQHHARLPSVVYEAMQGFSSGRFAILAPPSEEFQMYFKEWIDRDGHPLWPFWSHIVSWWELRHRQNVIMLHYEDILANPGEQIVKIGTFLGKSLRSEEVIDILALSTKDYMARNIRWIFPEIDLVQGGEGKSFFAGLKHGWKGKLSESDIALYRKTARVKLGAELAVWLESRADK